MPRVLISAAHKSSGKTTITLGLCAALRHRGLAVQPFKKGPDYIDPMWLRAAAGRDCHNLDFNTMPAEEIRGLFARHATGADISIIEGNNGLYDGLDLEGSNSNAAMAVLLAAPVVLVVDCGGMTRGIAPLLRGYQAFDPEVRIAGVILNKVANPRHESKLRAAVEHYTDIPVLGTLHRDAGLEIKERHLGLVPTDELGGAAQKLASVSAALARQIDLDRLLALAAEAPPLSVTPALPPSVRPADTRIGIARDSAFGFYYSGDLEAMTAAGVELVPIDLMSQASLPALDGLFIGGGFPETHAAALEENASMRAAIRDAIEGGLPVYAECGGLMYLARTIAWDGETRRMAGVIPADVVVHDRPRGHGYIRLQETGAGPWPLQGHDGTPAQFSAHEFHYSDLQNLEGEPVFAYEVLRGFGVDGRHDGIVYKRLLASYAHLRDAGGNDWTRRFVGYVRACRSG